MKFLKYIIPIVLVLIVAAGGVYWYLAKKTDQPLLPIDLKSKTEIFSNDNDKPEEVKPLLKNLGPAPEFVGLDKWYNTEPIKSEQFKGKVTLVNFWTYSSINCIRSVPYITDWYTKYKEQGFNVVGIHTPEFAFGKVQLNVESAIKKYAIGYPVAMDNNYKTWTAYHNQFWPAYYLIDKDGNIVYAHYGEGKYNVTEKAIRTLLGLEGDFKIEQQEPGSQTAPAEMYLGLTKLKSFGGSEDPKAGNQIYTFPAKLKQQQFALEGNWEFNQEAAVHTKGFGRIRLNFASAKVFLVAQSNQPTTIKVYVDGQLVKGVVVSNSELYQLYDSLSNEPHTMEIEVPDAGFQAFTFTFG